MVPYSPLGIFCNQIFVDYAQSENENFYKKTWKSNQNNSAEFKFIYMQV